jgi:hypothetical protein
MSELTETKTRKERYWSKKVTPPAGFPEPAAAMFHGLLGDIIDAVEDRTEADPVGILASLLAECGALLGSGPKLEISGVKCSSRLFILLVGPTAEGRKGMAGEVARDVVTASGIGRPEGFLQRGFASGEAVIEVLAQLEGRRVLYRQDEMAGLLVAMNREGSTLSSVVRDLWDGVVVTHTTVASTVEVEDAHVSVLGHITPDEFRLRLRAVDPLPKPGGFTFCLI